MTAEELFPVDPEPVKFGAVFDHRSRYTFAPLTMEPNPCTNWYRDLDDWRRYKGLRGTDVLVPTSEIGWVWDAPPGSLNVLAEGVAVYDMEDYRFFGVVVNANPVCRDGIPHVLVRMS